MNWWLIGLFLLVGLAACVGLGMLLGYLYVKIAKRPRSQKPEKVIRSSPIRNNPTHNNRQVNLATRRNEFRVRPFKVFATNPNDPEEGRIFLLTKVGWFERLNDPSGDLIFTQVGQSEDELLKFVAQDNPSIQLFALGREDIKVFYDELRELLPLRDLKRYFVTGRESKNKLLTITGISLFVLGLLIFGTGIYFRLAYSPTNIKTVGSYKQQFEQIYYGGLAAIIVGAIMDIFGLIIFGLASIGKG